MSTGLGAIPSDVDVIIALDTLNVMGGVQRVVDLVADGLARTGRRVGVVALRRERDRPVTTLVSAQDVPAAVLANEPTAMPYSPYPRHRAARLRLRGRRDAVRSFTRGVQEIRSLLARFRHPPTVIAMQLQSAEFWLAAGAIPERLVLQWHGSFEQAKRSRELSRIRWVSRRVARTLALNAGDASKFADAGVRRTGWIRNPVDHVTLTRPDRERRPRPQRIVAGGRFVVDKGYDLLIDAWAQVADRHPGWELVIHGEGPQRDHLAHRAAEARRHGVAVAVQPPADDLPQLLRESAIHVLPSRDEGMGLVIAEAMCCGTPTVAFDCSSGVNELLAGTAGVLVPAEDVEALADALSGLIRDPDRRAAIAASGRRRVEDFSIDRTITAWNDVLDGLPTR